MGSCGDRWIDASTFFKVLILSILLNQATRLEIVRDSWIALANGRSLLTGLRSLDIASQGSAFLESTGTCPPLGKLTEAEKGQTYDFATVTLVHSNSTTIIAGRRLGEAALWNFAFAPRLVCQIELESDQ
jgi:hypothetical protein